MAGNKITRKDIIEEKVISIGSDYAKGLQSAIEANEKWLQSFKPIKEAALAQITLSNQFKISQGQKEFLQVKKLQEEATRKANEALKAEQALLVAKQKVEQSVLDTERKTIALTNQKLKSQQQSVKLSAQEKLELSLLNRGKREAAVISSKLSTEYERQSKILIQLRRRYKDVALTQGESSKAAKLLETRITTLDNRLKRVDANVGQFQRSVGNYSKAMNSARSAARGLASALGLVGGAFLVVQVARDATKVLKDFEKGNATLSAILQVEKEDMKGLTDEAIRLGSTTVKTAGQITELQIAYARLGFSQSEILDLTSATINGSIAMNAELSNTATLTGAVVNTFDDLSTSDAPRILDILSLATAKSALNFSKLETGIPIVAGAANAAGVPFTKLVALMGKLSDSGIDVSTSSTALKNIFIESAAQGLNYEEILQKIKDSQDKLTASNDEFGTRAAVSATVLSANIDATNEFDEALNKAAGTAERMANKELDTLDGALKLLRSAWEGYILGANESGGATEKLKVFVKGLADNLENIFGVIITATKAWVAYKAITLLAGVQQKLLALSIASSNKALVINRLASIRAAQGLTLTSSASIKAAIGFKRFTAALKANAIFLIVSAIVGLVTILSKANKSIIDTSNELHKANEEFAKQAELTIELNDSLDKAASRYDELKNKSELTKDEQIELDKIIKLIAKHVPEAVTEVDKYGDALEINTEKVKNFNTENGKISLLKAEIAVKKQTEVLDKLKTKLKEIEDVTRESGETNVKGIGIVEKVNGKLQVITKNYTEYGHIIKTSNDLTKEQQLIYAEYVKSVEDGIKTTEKDIETNKNIIGSITGVKDARQLEIEAKKKAIEDAAALAAKKQEEILVVKQLREEISLQEQFLKDLTKNGYENLTKAEADLIVQTRKLISEKKKELDTILGITKANKNAEKSEQDRLNAEKKLRNDAFKLSQFSLKAKIDEQKAIVENDNNTFEQRKDAIQKQGKFELELARLVAGYKLTETEGFNQKEIDQLLSKNELTLEETEKLTDSQLLIFKEFQAKKNSIQKGTENATEEGERRIAEIKKRYALEALDAQVKAIETLLKTEELSAEDRAKFEEKLSALKLVISTLNTEAFIENNDKKVENEYVKTQQILEISADLASALTDLTNAIFDAKIQKIDQEIEASDSKYEKLLANELLSEKERKAIERRQELDKEKLEKKKREQQRKQAVLNKAAALTEIAINTAIAISKVLGQTGIFGLAAWIPIAALGALQAAEVAAAPIPAYAKGTDNHPGGKALVGEERPEVIQEPNKAPYVIDKPTIVDLPRSTKVTPSLKEYEQLMRASILSSVDIDNQRLNTFQAKVLVNNNYDSLLSKLDSVEKAIKNQPKQPIHFHERKIDIDHAIWASKNINWS